MVIRGMDEVSLREDGENEKGPTQLPSWRILETVRLKT